MKLWHCIALCATDVQQSFRISRQSNRVKKVLGKQPRLLAALINVPLGRHIVFPELVSVHFGQCTVAHRGTLWVASNRAVERAVVKSGRHRAEPAGLYHVEGPILRRWPLGPDDTSTQVSWRPPGHWLRIESDTR